MRKNLIVVLLLVAVLQGNPAITTVYSAPAPEHSESYVDSEVKADSEVKDQAVEKILFPFLSTEEIELMREVMGPVLDLYESGFFTNENTRCVHVEVNLYKEEPMKYYPVDDDTREIITGAIDRCITNIAKDFKLTQ